MKNSIRQEITDKIIAAIEAGTPPWRASWTSNSCPVNGRTLKNYHGLNRLLLMQAVADANGENRFMTFKQASAMGYTIRKGAKAYRIVRLAEVDRKPDDTPPEDGEVVAEDKQKRLILRAHSVFVGTDIEGLPPLEKVAQTIEPVEAAERVVEGMKATGLIIVEGGDKAFYSPKTDTVRMPDRWRFKEAVNAPTGTLTAEWWSVALHELGHATGHDTRMSRKDLGSGWGSPGYAREELRVEIASFFLGSELGIPMAESLNQSHAAYLSSWIEALKKDPQEILRAAADAQRIADYLNEHALKPEANDEAKVDSRQDLQPAALADAPAAMAANQATPKRRRASMRM